MEKRYLSVKDWVKKYGYFPVGGIRHLIFTNKEFERHVVKRVGRRILLDVTAFETWIDKH